MYRALSFLYNGYYVDVSHGKPIHVASVCQGYTMGALPGIYIKLRAIASCEQGHAEIGRILNISACTTTG